MKLRSFRNRVQTTLEGTHGRWFDKDLLKPGASPASTNTMLTLLTQRTLPQTLLKNYFKSWYSCTCMICYFGSFKNLRGQSTSTVLVQCRSFHLFPFSPKWWGPARCVQVLRLHPLSLVWCRAAVHQLMTCFLSFRLNIWCMCVLF